MKNTKLEKEFKLERKKTNVMNKSSKRGILFVVALFSISLILIPSNAYAEKVDVESIGLDKTTIITLTNISSENVKTFRIWLSQNANFESFKTEKGWVGEKTPQGVIIFTSSGLIQQNESVKFGIKTDNSNPAINWKALDKNNEIIKTGITQPDELIKVIGNPNLENINKLDREGDIFAESKFKIIPDKPNSGSTVRVVGENFGSSQIFNFYVNEDKIGEFYTDDEGKFITTMKIPEVENNDRIDLKVKNDKGDAKIYSLRLGENENRIPEVENIKLSIDGIENIVFRGEKLQLQGTANPNTSITIEITNPENEKTVTRTAKVDSKGDWNLIETINIPYDSILGKYSVILSDGRNQILKNWEVKSDKVILINPAKVKFDAGELIKFNGTVIPNQSIQLVLENDLGEELISDTVEIGDTGFVEFEYQTTENEDKEGTWTLVVTQGQNKEFIFVGYDVLPITPTKLEFDKINYKPTENAIIDFAGQPSSKLKMIIVSPSGNMDENAIIIQLREDGKAQYELDLTGYASGTYTAVIQKDNFQTSENFSIGLQTGSGAIKAETTSTEYFQGDKILLIGNTGNNALMTITLLDPTGKEIRTLQIGSNAIGQFSEDRLRIPSNGVPGAWQINISSGTNEKILEIDVFEELNDSMVVKVVEAEKNQGYGDHVKIIITATHKTSITIEISNEQGDTIDKSLTCNTTSDFKCEVLWAISNELPAGEYIVKVKDSISSAETKFSIK